MVYDHIEKQVLVVTEEGQERRKSKRREDFNIRYMHQDLLISVAFHLRQTLGRSVLPLLFYDSFSRAWCCLVERVYAIEIDLAV